MCFKLVSVKNGQITLPKIGKVKIFKDAQILGIAKTAVIKIEPTGIFISMTHLYIPALQKPFLEKILIIILINGMNIKTVELFHSDLLLFYLDYSGSYIEKCIEKDY